MLVISFSCQCLWTNNYRWAMSPALSVLVWIVKNKQKLLLLQAASQICSNQMPKKMYFWMHLCGLFTYLCYICVNERLYTLCELFRGKINFSVSNMVLHGASLFHPPSPRSSMLTLSYSVCPADLWRFHFLCAHFMVLDPNSSAGRSWDFMNYEHHR